METSERPTLGERVASRLERLSSRERRRPRLAFSPALYARLGVDDPWAVSGTAGDVGAPVDGFVFLSAQPYYAMLRRLAAARRRRERRLERFGAPRLGEGRMASVAVPSAGLNLVPSRLARLAAGDWILPAAPVAAPAAAAEGAPAAAAPRPDTFVPARTGTWGGWTAPSTPARAASVGSSFSGGGGDPLRNASPSVSGSVPARDAAPGASVSSRATTGSAAARPLDRIGRGTPPRALPAPLAAALQEAVATVAPARRAMVRQVEETLAFLPADEQVVAVRRLVRVLGVRARAAQDEIAVLSTDPTILPPRVARPSAVRRAPSSVEATEAPVAPVAQVSAAVRASHRMDAEASVATGLRPVLRRSPAMALAASADTDRAASFARAEAERTERSPASHSAARPVRAGSVRAAARASAGAVRLGSALPAPIAAVVPSQARSLIPRVAVRAAVGTSSAREGSERPSRALGPRPQPFPAARRDADADPAVHGRLASDADLRTPAVTPERVPASARAVARAYAAEAAAPVILAPLASPALASSPLAAQDTGLLRRVASSHAVEERPARASARATGEGLRVRRASVAAEGVVPQLPREVEAASAGVPAASPAGALPSRSSPTGASSARPAAWPAPRAARPDAAAVAPRVVGTVWAQVRSDLSGPVPRSVLPTRTPRDAARAVLASSSPTGGGAVDPTTRSVLVAPRDVAERVTARGDAAATRPALARPVAPEMRPLAVMPDQAVEASALPVSTPRGVRAAVVAAADRATRASVTSLADAGNAPSLPGASPRRVEGPLAFARGSRTVAPRASDDGRAAIATAVGAGAVGTRAVVAPDALVRTPEGRFDSARAAVARGLVVLATAQGLIAAPAAEAAAVLEGGSPVARRAGRAAARPRDATDTTRTRGIPVRDASAGPARGPSMRGVSPDLSVLVVPAGIASSESEAGVSSGPVPVRPRAVERASARARVEESNAYRGAYRAARTVPADRMASARIPSTERDATGETPSRTTPGVATAAPSRAESGTPARGATRSASRAAPERAVVRPGDAPLPADGGAETTGPSDAGPQRPRRGSFDERMARVASGRTDGATGWVDRAEGSPRLRTVSGLIQALARASSNEDVVRVIAARGDLSAEATRLPLDAPAVAVIQQIRAEVRDEVAAASEPVLIGPSEVRASRLSAPEATSLAPQALGSTESTARVVRGRAVRAAATARRAAGAEDRLSRLVRRLQDLIHLAEDQNRLAEARSQVRMAEDSAEARAEGQAPMAGAGADTAKADMEALGRDVLDAVTKELELRRARRMEDGDESPWW